MHRAQLDHLSLSGLDNDLFCVYQLFAIRSIQWIHCNLPLQLKKKLFFILKFVVELIVASKLHTRTCRRRLVSPKLMIIWSSMNLLFFGSKFLSISISSSCALAEFFSLMNQIQIRQLPCLTGNVCQNPSSSCIPSDHFFEGIAICFNLGRLFDAKGHPFDRSTIPNQIFASGRFDSDFLIGAPFWTH